MNLHGHGIMMYDRGGFPELARKEWAIQQIPVDMYLAIWGKN